MTIVDALSTPHTSVSREVSRSISLRLAERVQASLVRCLTKLGHGQLAEQVEQAPADPQGAWRPEVGLVARRTGEECPVVAALQWLGAFGRPGLHVEVYVREPSAILHEGEIYPVSGSVSLRVNESSRSAGSRVLLLGNRGAEKTSANHSASPSWSYSPYIAEVESGAPGSYPDPIALAARRMQHSEAETTEVWRAYEAVAEDPDYGPWVASVVRGVLITSGGSAISSTDPEYPGLVALPGTAGALESFERLVDAASQQKLFQLSLACELVAKREEEIHYVPSRRTYVTTRRLFAAAHQHVNAIGALASLNAHRLEGQLAKRIATRRLLLDTECFDQLDESTSLTEEGHAVWRNLKGALERARQPDLSRCHKRIYG